MKVFQPASRRTLCAGITLLTIASLSHADTASANMVNTVTVTGSCTVSASGFTTTYDPISINASAPKDTTAAVNTTCTVGTAATIRLGQGLNVGASSTDAVPVRRLSNGAATPTYISYILTQDSARAVNWGNTLATGAAVTGTGSPLATTVYARIAPGQTFAGPGIYTDTVIATVEF